MQIKDFLINQELEELTQHRTVELPLACYETKIKENIHGHIPLHWHNEIQFVLIINGSAAFQINEEKVKVSKGEGIFINSGCLHKADDYNNSGCIYICLNASPEIFLSKELHAKYVYPYIQATNLTHLHIGRKDQWERNILKAILDIHQLIEQKDPFYEIDIVNHLNLIWQNLIMNGMQLEYSESDRIRNQRMKRMLHWIHLHFDEKITLADIAKAGQLSRAECCRYFKRIVNQSPMNYVIEYRIQKSLPLLQNQNSNVTEVAYQIGFNSSSYFIAKFRKSIGMTPLAYKKQSRGQLKS
ncbi:AraC family transcriptional regulator [Terribacillus sp. 7520-G]|uniref:AraC family transcriptional regulator n=1 Tax=Terribacillus TaxID=459532 RepID=UPI000BA6BE2E|nr:AraC family transcriptional regulator [Terribacillus sp. 7520-G]PAD39196.1 AraC family transcriptional regulator [Terribacillus sp. 7520-G]